MADSRTRSRRSSNVGCIACGKTLPRDDAREYDKYGDRWDREGKDLEDLCKPCHRACCHQPRGGSKELLTRAETEHSPEFVTAYYAPVSEDASTEPRSDG
ncbi:DUF7562 family protein [Halobellus ruber]|uniref:Uncharacterized protein n=1 Tax=Halobellus ruber TaxID=2761102 RepID=A0A7J9SP45_9EURY|nr:hypothetical protein [Halobellus ruber]MBB6647071.1 hypothetical protein [Halobellus ruber]